MTFARLNKTPRDRAAPGGMTDICLILEGSYPHVFGGVSGWTDTLIRAQSHLRFGVVAITAAQTGKALYPPPPNLKLSQEIPLHVLSSPSGNRRLRAPDTGWLLADGFDRLLSEATPEALRDLGAQVDACAGEASIAAILDSPVGWEMARETYHRHVPGDSFIQFYWAWRALVGGLLAVLRAPIPKAQAYHAITTGYAGLFAARAGIETGRPVLLTEHGIYTNERRIDLMLADWIHPTFAEAGRADVTAFWITAFESFASVCYAASRDIVSLSRAGRAEQIALGAPQDRCRIIPNGIDVERFASLPLKTSGPPRIALLGRVVPIKDVHCFIRTVAALRRTVPDVEAVVAGPQDEDPEYFATCRTLVAELGLQEVIRFPGTVPVHDVLSDCDVLVLTSISESQPLALLEAGAAGLPCVATHVGACREMLEGSPDEIPNLGPGGIVTRLAAPDEIAAHLAALLGDPALRRRMGEAARHRVRRHYSAEAMRTAYAELYDDALQEEPRWPVSE